MLHVVRTIIAIFISVPVCSQSFVYSKTYFRWPLNNDPGIVANFGELREGHWHMGLDIRTDHKVNLPVYAAADGYISRIGVHPFGYGQAIYINHPNGLTTVYGHLNKFFPGLDSFIKVQQYKQQSWSIDIEFDKDQFPVKKGQFIALSGSTGSSQGPHVHFEIRDTKTERCINPLFFDLPVPDAVPPVFTRVAMYDRNRSVYDQSPVLFPVKRTKNTFSLTNSLVKTSSPRVGFAIDAFDCVSGSTNPNGIYSGKIFMDAKPLIEFVLDSMDYNETDYVDAHVDYRYHYNHGVYLQQLFKLPGDEGRAYRLTGGDGTLQLNDTKVHRVSIEIRDIRGNASTLTFNIQLTKSSPSIPAKNSTDKIWTPGFANVFEQPDFELYLSDNALYDSVHPTFSRLAQPVANAASSLFRISDPSIPVHGPVNIRIKPDIKLAAKDEAKMVIKRTDQKSTDYRKAEWQQDWLAARFTALGSYQAFIDNQPPTINDLGTGDTVDLSGSRTITFQPQDNTAIKTLKAELDGHWLMFSNDKGSVWTYSFDEKCGFGVHRLKLTVEDIAGNVTEKQWWFRKSPDHTVKPKTKGLKKTLKTGKKHTRKGR